MGRRCVFACFFALCWISTTSLVVRRRGLDPFDVIVDCLPFNLKVEPSKDDSYAMRIIGDEHTNAVTLSITDGVLTLGVRDGFRVIGPYRIAILVPKKKLKRVIKSSPSTLVLSSGFELEQLTVMTNSMASVRIFDAKIDDLIVQAGAFSEVFAHGIIRRTRLEALGLAKIYVYGIRKSAEVFARDAGRIYLKPRRDDVTVDGTVERQGEVFVTKGTCDIERKSKVTGCKTVKAKTLPRFEAVYSCGFYVPATVHCAKDGTGTIDLSKGISERDRRPKKVSRFAAPGHLSLASGVVRREVKDGSDVSRFRSGTKAARSVSERCDRESVDMMTP